MKKLAIALVIKGAVLGLLIVPHLAAVAGALGG
jgi:hypothetical protein